MYIQKLDVPGWGDEKADIKQPVEHYLSGKIARCIYSLAVLPFLQYLLHNSRR